MRGSLSTVTMPKVAVDGVNLFYQSVGADDAEPLVLIMGWGGDHTAWAYQVPAFAAHYRVIALDNRGAGQSDVPDEPYSIAGMAEETLAVLDRLQIRRAHICGASMGGMIAQEIALRRPERVLTLQLHCTVGRIDAYGLFLIDAILRAKAALGREDFARVLIPWVMSRKTLVERGDFARLFLQRALDYPYPTTVTGLSRQGEAIRGHDTLDRLGAIRMPTLITTGAEDILVPPSSSHALHARVVGSELVEVQRAGHLHFMEEFEIFNALCLEFLNKHRAT